MCYMDHHKFLAMDHPYRMDKRSFNSDVELRSSPALLDGEQIFENLKDFDNVFGKKQKNKIDGPWKKRSIFFELPYWKQNTLRYCLDVMHIEKSVCDNIIGTLLDILKKSKDHANTCYDLKDMGIRKKLQSKEINGGKKAKITKACFNFTNQEKTIFYDLLKSVKLPSGSASNISRCVHVAEKKISVYKSHDAHFMLHYLLQVAIKCRIQNQVAGPLIYLGSFFRFLCQKVVENDTIDHLEVDIIEILCQLERIFPPSFFDIMVHLPIHLVNELRLGGLVQFRWMYPIKRYLCRLQSYVHNKSRPEGSIAKGYLAEECLTFCSRYLSPDVDTRLSRRTQNYDNWKGIKDKEAIWKYVQAKFIISTKGKRMVLARINDNWRRYKTTIKQTHFLPYKCVNVMLKNRPKSIPESHFCKLIAYWRTEKVKKMSAQNKKNRAQQKFRHRKGLINFARIRERLAASKENNEPPT
ncbi:uncharacterized protein LOC127742490 [Arachis duranensis]|uniref:Uncharacterized protein LOC127742490 n=1 Tax=Arachis duranensis TaxID=130453 RepID=A0A9C6WNH2_ARADU|nr:uncharacterized protein LOC127742490 [Arachis duranensis]